RRAAGAKSPGGQRGNDSLTSAAGSHPQHQLFGKATPGPATHPATLADTAADPLPAAFPTQLPARASGQPGPGPGKDRPRSRPQAVRDRPGGEPIMPRSGKEAPSGAAAAQ